jgi:hypothetical protein
MYLVVSYRLDMNSPDITWTFSPIVLWAGVEMNLGVISGKQAYSLGLNLR